MSTRQGIKQSVSRSGVVTGTLLVLLPLSVLISMSIGPVHVPVSGILSELAGRHRLDPTSQTIVFALRLPHILATACVGACLAVAGLLFQGLFRNPLADPYVIGSSSGSLLGATVAIFWFPAATFAGLGATALFTFVGATLTVGLVYMLAHSGNRASSNTLLLAGFALGTMLNGVTFLIETLSASNIGLRALQAWLQGTIGTPTWQQLATVSLMMLLGLFLSSLMLHRLNAMALGDEYAQQLGIPLERTRGVVIIAGALLTAAAVALGGIIGFVGLIVPHVMRMLQGPDHRRLLLACALGGGVFVVLADTLARTVLSPAELPVGILMAFLGGPFFLVLLRRRPEVYAQ